MLSDWTKGFTGEALESRKKQVKGFRYAFEELTKLVEGRKKSPIRDYGSGWEYRQIAVNEYNQALDDLISLISIKDND